MSNNSVFHVGYLAVPHGILLGPQFRLVAKKNLVHRAAVVVLFHVMELELK